MNSPASFLWLLSLYAKQQKCQAIWKKVYFFLSRPASTRFAFLLLLCYTGIAALTYSGNREGVCKMDSLFNSFLVTVAANVVSYYICKWLDSHRKGK